MNSTLGNRHGSAVITVSSDTEILITRQFDAPAELQTEIFEGMPGAEAYPSEPAVNTMTLDESDGVTTMTLLIQVPNQEIRDAILASGMEHGLQISYNRLEDLVRSTG